MFPLFHFHIYIYFKSIKCSDSMKVLYTIVFFISLSFNLHPSTDPFTSFSPLGI